MPIITSQMAGGQAGGAGAWLCPARCRSKAVVWFILFAFASVLPTAITAAESEDSFLARPGLYHQLTEPPCSYCSTQNRKGLIRLDDRVLAWIRGAHNGGAIPLRYFLAGPRVINDTYGLFFYDPDGGYVSAFKKDSGYEFHGWRRGIMMVKGKDGTLWCALTGRGIEGPQAGRRLERLPSFTTDWGYWLMLHPESTAYDLFDGKRYVAAELPTEMTAEARRTMSRPDPRLPALTPVLGVELNAHGKAFPLDEHVERACWRDRVAGQDIAVFWYGPTRSAVAFSCRLDDKTLTFYADEGSPETAPFKDKETGSRWTLAGRAVDGPLRGRELEWVRSVQCRWYAWTAEYPETEIYAGAAPPPQLKIALLSAHQATIDKLAELKNEGITGVALMLTDTNVARELQAAERVVKSGNDLHYWIEVARNPMLADAHPEWMASIQTHPEWHRFFPQFPAARTNEVVKVYPWVPVLYRETFDVHLRRVETLLRNKPAPRRLFLNDLQGAPSACGCGHPLCRWTTDYGPLTSATRLPNRAAADFVTAVKRLAPGVEVVPVWTTECEEHDQQGLCAGVGCFRGTCWREWTEQLTPLAAETDRLAVLTPYRAFHREGPEYGQPAGWVASALGFFRQMPMRYGTNGVPASRLIAVVQGWDVTSEQVHAQMARASEAGAAGVVAAFTEIEQGWEPRMFGLTPH